MSFLMFNVIPVKTGIQSVGFYVLGGWVTLISNWIPNQVGNDRMIFTGFPIKLGMTV